MRRNRTRRFLGERFDGGCACGDPRLSGAGGKSANRRVCFKSIISDTFNGSLVSTVQCNTCERLSSTLEVFQDLSLPIPSGEHLTAVQKKSVIGQSGYGYQTWWLTSLLTWPLSWMRGLFGGPRVTLQDCLAAFFSNDDLKGDNMYHCEKCGKLRNGVKYSRISRLPEMLTVHLKRFRHDYLFSMKIGAPVAFPIEGLDMKPYLHRDCRARQTVYDLTAVVCHFGSTLGGHYTAYALNHAGMQWYEFDDSRVRKVDVSAVDSCQAYVLFYRKRDEWMQPLRMRVKEVIETPQDSSSLMPFYISRPWLNKFNTFGDPGPISNEDFLCPHQLLSPHIPDCAETMVIRLPYAAWDLLMGQFGGGPTVNRLGPCPECTAELERSRGRAAAELETVEREMENFKRSSGSVYLISMRWFRRWEGFVYQRNLEPPGHIDNSAIVVRRGKGLAVRPNSDYAQVSGRIWRYLLSIYSGGPEVRLGSAKQSSSSDTSSSDSRRSSVSSGGDANDANDGGGGGGSGCGVGGRGDCEGKEQAENNGDTIMTTSATPQSTAHLDDADKD